MRPRLGPGLIAVALGAVVVWLLFVGERPVDPVERGRSAPAFSLPEIADGHEVSLSALRGRVVLLNFWATWCKPCEDEMPSMQQLYRELRGDGFELVAISVDTDPDVVREFRDRLGLSFPILLDPAQKAAGAYQTTGFPESFLIDRTGVVATQRFIGPRDWADPAYLNLVRRLIEVEAD